jgi:glycosyltransferase involved in cell wall biosynthesis
LHEQGLGHKAVLFPHPIPNFGHKISHKIVDSGKIVIGTSGFALPHKGLIELISAVNELARSGHSVELKLFTPEHPDPSSREHLIEVYKQIEKMKNLSIHLDETFHEEENLISLLSSCDLLVYAHQVTGEAASGTVHHGLASGRPVLVTPSSIFQDSSECLYFTDGFSATDIAKSISLLISNLKGNGYGEEREIAVKQKLITESFAASAARLEGMGIGILNSLD